MNNKTVVTKNIDGIDIIQGFSTLQIDAEATKLVVNPLLEVSDEMKALYTKQAETSKILEARNASFQSAKQAYLNKDTALHAKHSYDVELRNEQLKTLNEELIELIKNVGVAKQRIWNENLVYFEPKTGEKALTEEEFHSLSTLSMQLKTKEFLSLDGKVITDKRGVKYVKDGKVLEVSKLGDEPNGELIENVTAEQFEVMRIENLTSEQLTAEVEAIKRNLLSQANNMRGELEIIGDTEALTKSQTWYKNELKKLEEKYKV